MSSVALQQYFRIAALQNGTTVQLDRIDKRLLELLQQDGKLSNQELAERVNLSPSPCLRRVRRLEEAGVIRQYVALLEPSKLGLGLLAYATVRLEKHGDSQLRSPVDSFREAVESWPEVIACYAMTGEMDYLLRVEARDLEHYSRFVMDHLLRHPAVVDVKSSFALERIKDTTALPLPS
jgi:Lrp/AsnC family leucine-responsive transcriptional regulator